MGLRVAGSSLGLTGWSGLTATAVLFSASATTIGQDGNFTFNGTALSVPELTLGALSSIHFTGLTANQILLSDGTDLTQSAKLTFVDPTLTLALGTITTAVGPWDISETRNAGAVTFPGLKYTITDTASAAASIAMQILGGVAGTTELLKLSKAGGFTVSGQVVGTSFASSSSSGNVIAGASAYLGWSGRCLMLSASTTTICLKDSSEVDFAGRFQFGGTTSSFPSIKKAASSTVLEARLADDSAAATWQGKYNSSDGTAGLASFSGAITNLTIKDGIVTAAS